MIINPSYLDPASFEILADGTGDDRWRELADSAREVVEHLTRGPLLPPDWALITRDGRPVPIGSPSDRGVDSAFSPVPGGLPGSTDAFEVVFGDPDLPATVELLWVAGFTERSPAQLELAYPPERYGLEIAKAMEAVELQLEATGLINVTLTAQPWSSYLGDVLAGSYHLAFLAWVPDFPDPHSFLAPFALDGGVGGSGKDLSPELISLVREGAAERDPTRREDIYRRAQLLYASEVVSIPLWLERPSIATGTTSRVIRSDRIPRASTWGRAGSSTSRFSVSPTKAAADPLGHLS